MSRKVGLQQVQMTSNQQQNNSENRAKTQWETSGRHSLTHSVQALVCQIDSQRSSRREYLRWNADCLWTACTETRELRLQGFPGHKKLKNALFLLK